MFWFSNLDLLWFSLNTTSNAGFPNHHKGAVEGKNCMEAKQPELIKQLGHGIIIHRRVFQSRLRETSSEYIHQKVLL